MHTLALAFPPVSHLLEWPDILFKDTLLGVNKVVLVFWAAVILSLALFVLGGKRNLVPTGIQNLAESAVTFIEDSVIKQTMGPSGLHFMPFLLAMFLFVFFCNIFEVIPFVQFPGNARMAAPAFLALLVWVLYNFLGIKHQGLKYVC